jgi:hypothetical protein
LYGVAWWWSGPVDVEMGSELRRLMFPFLPVAVVLLGHGRDLLLQVKAEGMIRADSVIMSR